MPPLEFTDEETDAISALTAPISANAARWFMLEVANKLAAYPQPLRGPGIDHNNAWESWPLCSIENTCA
jgi:hypothetical protein